MASTAQSALTLAAAVLVTLKLVAGLSYPVCDTIGEEWTTAAPRLEGEWPYYSLLYTCSGSLNIEGFDVDACVLNGTRCGQAAADAFCQYLGFDNNAPGLYSTGRASAPAFSLTGEWCVSPGNYEDLGHPNRTQFDAIKAANVGPYCGSLTSVACIRSRSSLSSTLPAIATNAAASPAPAPQAPATKQQSTSASLPVNPVIASAGRRLMAH